MIKLLLEALLEIQVRHFVVIGLALESVIVEWVDVIILQVQYVFRLVVAQFGLNSIFGFTLTALPVLNLDQKLLLLDIESVLIHKFFVLKPDFAEQFDNVDLNNPIANII